METETKQYQVMCIMPNGVVEDATVSFPIPLVNQRVTIQDKSYRVVEAHSSAVPDKWDFIISLAN